MGGLPSAPKLGVLPRRRRRCEQRHYVTALAVPRALESRLCIPPIWRDLGGTRPRRSEIDHSSSRRRSGYTRRDAATRPSRHLEPAGHSDRNGRSRVEAVHGEAGAVSRVHLLLHEDPRETASRIRSAAILPSHATGRASNDQDARCARIHRPSTRGSPLDKAAVDARPVAGSRIALRLEVNADREAAAAASWPRARGWRRSRQSRTR